MSWIVFAACLMPVCVSLAAALLGPSNSTMTIRIVEWLRDHGAASIANGLEGDYYALNAPSTGGPALRALPRRPPGTITARRTANISPLLSPALAGEGVYAPSETWSGAGSPVQIAQFRSDPAYPRMVAGVARIDPRRTVISLSAGRLEPSVSVPRGPMEVPPSARRRLLATFNSGFKLVDDHGGWADHGVTYAPLRDGQATLVGYADGRVDVVSWDGGPRAGPGVDFARQNLPLIVSGGRPNPALGDGPEWGATLGNAVRVWRSGVGIAADGDLLYAAADDQTVASLAAILIHAAAVRAMELDINSYWVTFNSYAEPNAAAPSALLPAMTRPVTRYLSPDDRDFFTVTLR